MSAPLLNAALFQPPGPAAGIGQGGGVAGAGQAATGGALAGFEAMLATLFGQVDAAGLPVTQVAAQTTGQLAGQAPVAVLTLPGQPADAAATETKGDKDKAAVDPAKAD